MEENRLKTLLDHVRDAIRLKHHSYRTEQAYAGWIKRYMFFHGVCHPSDMDAPEVEDFLTHLAVKENIAVSTQNQALRALLFLYHEMLLQDLGSVESPRAKRPERLPTVLTKEDTLRLIACLSDTPQLMAKLIHSSGELNPNHICALGTCAGSHAPRRVGSEQSLNGCAFSARTGDRVLLGGQAVTVLHGELVAE